MQLLTAATLAAFFAVLPFVGAVPTAAVELAKADPSGTSKVENGNFTILAAGNFQAFDGNSCNGNAGAVVGFSTTNCIGTANRHSFRVTGCTAQVLVWDNGSCGGTFRQYTVSPNSCVNVNTGLSWRSSSVQCA
jgi:hypothetical protein